MYPHHQDALSTYEWREAAMRVLTSGGTARVGLERRSADLSLRGDCRPVQVPITASPRSRPLLCYRRPHWRWPAAAYAAHRAPRDLTTGRFAVLDTVFCPDEHAAGGFRPCPGQGTGAHPSSATSGNAARASTRGVIEVPARPLRVVPDVRAVPDVRPALAACGQGDEWVGWHEYGHSTRHAGTRECCCHTGNSRSKNGDAHANRPTSTTGEPGAACTPVLRTRRCRRRARPAPRGPRHRRRAGRARRARRRARARAP